MVLLLDGMSILYRSFHALPPMNTAAGEPTSGLYGFAALLCKLLREERPDGIAIALDSPGPTVRHASFEGYKAGRAAAPDDLRAQVRELPGLAAAMGARLHRVPGQEADDVLATLARRIPEPTVVVSGDTDLVQVADERVTVLFIGRRQADHIRYDPATVRERYGFEPRLIPTWKAMVGDPTDNLPGIKGFGPSTAKKLLSEHGDAAAILAALDAGRITGRTAGLVEAAREELLRWEAMGRLESGLGLGDPLWAPVDREGLKGWFERWEMKSLIKRI